MRHKIMFSLVIALALTACQKKASGQTVAVVNNEEITTAELNDALTSDPSLAQAKTKEARAAVLQKLIDRKLLVQQARKDGIDKSPEYISRQRQTTDDLLITMLVSKRLNTSQLPSADQINRFQASHSGMFAGREIWTLEQLLYPIPKDAAINAKLNAANSLDQIAQILTSSGIQFTRSGRKLDTATLPQAVYGQIAAIKSGEPFIVPGTDKAIASVIANREPQPIAGDQARSLALNGMRNEQANTIVQDRVKSLRSTAKIEYQPGFGPPPPPGKTAR